MSLSKTNGKRNRTAGHTFERQMAQLFRAAGFAEVVSSRSESKNRDDKGIDLMNRDELKNGRLPYNVQCKNSTERPKYDQLLRDMPQEPGIKGVIIHKYTARVEQRFITRGIFAILSMTDFMEMVAELERLRKTAISLGKEIYNPNEL